MTKAQRLRWRLTQDAILNAPGIYDCLSAKIAEACGFEAANGLSCVLILVEERRDGPIGHTVSIPVGGEATMN